MGKLPLILDSDTSRYQIWGAKLEQDIDVFLTRIVITKDDILRYADKIPECKNAKLKEPILVDIYIYLLNTRCVFNSRA